MSSNLFQILFQRTVVSQCAGKRDECFRPKIQLAKAYLLVGVMMTLQLYRP